MQSIFQDKLTNDHTQTQNYALAQGYETKRYEVTTDEFTSTDYAVSIFDEAVSSIKPFFQIQFRTSQAASDFATAMEHEIGYWNVEDFYSGESISQEATKDYERREMAAVQADWGWI